MGITEKQRHDLFRKFEETLGPEHAATMMELLPPVGWADVATKRDLDAFEVAWKRDLDAFEVAWKRDLDALAVATKRDLDALRHDLDAVEERLTLRMATTDDVHQLRRDFATWLFAAMGVQTAIIGILVALV